MKVLSIAKKRKLKTAIHVKPEQLKQVTLVAMCLALFMATLDDTIINVALPQIQLDLDSSIDGLQWVVNSYTLPIACLVLPSGNLGDIYGRKRIFLIGTILFTLASIFSGLAINLPMLIIGRIFQGVGAAALIPGSLALLSEAFPDSRERAKAIGIWTAISGLALLAGPVLGGVLVEVLGWQSLFWMNLPLGILTLLISWRFVQSQQRYSGRKLDLAGMVTSIVLIGGLACGLAQENFQSLWLWAVIGASLVAFLVIESYTKDPMLPLHLFRNKVFTIVSVINILLFFTLVSSLFIFSLFLQQILGYSATGTGLRFLPLNSAFVMASLLSGLLTARLGWRFAVAAGLTMAGVATLSFTHIEPTSEYSSFAWKLVLSGFGGGLALSPLATAAMITTTEQQSGIAAAILNTTTRLGGLLGIALQGKVFTQKMTSDLQQRLSTWNLSDTLQDHVVSSALHNVTTVPHNLPAHINPQGVYQETQAAFVSGLHAAALVGGLALLAGVALIMISLPSKFKPNIAKGE